MNRNKASWGCCSWLLAILFLLIAGPNARADLMLSINTTAQTFSFSGSDTGTFSDSGNPYKQASWLKTGLGNGGGLSGGPDSIVQTNGLWSSSVGSPTAGFGEFSFRLQVDNQAGGAVQVSLFNTVNGPTTVTGLGLNTSYALLSEANKLTFEAVNGMSIPLQSGSGFGSINPVPEPSSLLLSGLAIFGAVGRRRRIESR